MSKDDPEIANIRVKLERIDENEITVVEIGDIDKAACSGVHVMETSEIGAIYVSKKVSAGKDGFAIHFEIGEQAKNDAMDLANKCQQIIDDLGSKPEDIIRTVANMKHELEEARKQLKAAVAASLRTLEPEKVGDTDVYSSVLATSDKTPVADLCEKRKGEGAVCAFVCKGQTLMVMMSSGSKAVDCKRILGETLAEFGGRGGGKPDFAQGGVPETDKADAMLASMKERIRQALL
jgi:alanyl-tRNA synthetase